MNTPLKKACVAVVVVIIASMFLSGDVIYLAGCSKKNGATWNSSYNANYKIVNGGYWANVEVTVKGPAAKLAVILTDTRGKSEVQIIEKDSMISNCQTVQLLMDDPQEGTYVLTVKTVDPEKVVWQKNIPLSLGQLAVADVKFDFSQNFGPFEGYWINTFSVVLNKDGNLPVIFSDISVELDGKKGRGHIVSGLAMADQQHAVGMDVSFQPTPEMEALDRASGGLPHVGAFFRPGERHSVKGKLTFNKNHTLAFEKEFVVPGKSTQATGAQSTNQK